jgi:ABC-type branched-subunit amino acid transport system substrate-binding protein
MLNNRTRAIAALMLGATVAFGACGSSGGSSATKATTAPSGSTSATTAAGSSSATTAGGSASTPAFTVMVIGTFTSPASYNVPEIVPAVKAAFAGTPVKILSCNDEASASTGLACEHQAVVDHVSAVVAGYAEVEEDESILTTAGIPVIGTTDSTSSNSFAVQSSAGEYAGIGVGLAKAGCQRLGILYLDGTDYLADAIVGNIKWQAVAKASIPINAPDLTPDIAKLAESKVQCIAISTEPNTVIQAMTAIKQSGLNVKVAMVSAILLPQVLSSLGSEANGIIAVEGQVDPDSTAPVVGVIKAAMKAVDPKAPLTTAAIGAWASAELLRDASQQIKGSVTAASMLTALNGLRNASTDGALPPFSAIPLTNKAYARFFAHYDIDYVVENGVLTQPSGFYDLASSLDNTSL